MTSESEPDDSLSSFLNSLGESLAASDDADVDLANILKTHILKVVPAQNAVIQAKDAILKLADQRANPPKPDVANG